MGFLGAIAVAALVLVIQSPKEFEPFIPTPGGTASQGVIPGIHLHAYFVVLVFALSLVAVCSIFGGFTAALLGSIKESEQPRRVEWFQFWYLNVTLTVAILALVIAIPLMVYPSSHVGAEGIGIAELFIVVPFYVLLFLRGREYTKLQRRKQPRKQATTQETPNSD